MKQFNIYLRGKGYSKTTRSKTIGEIRHFTSWAEQEGIPVTEVTYGDILGYIAQLKQSQNSQRTIQIKVQALKHYYTYLQDRGEIHIHPCQEITIKGVRRKMLHIPLGMADLETIYRSYQGQHPLTDRRNKIILGLIIYQGLRSEELAALSIHDLYLREGKICIHAQRRTAGRELKLQPGQVMDMLDYLNETRKALLELTGKQTDKVFISIGQGEGFANLMAKLLKGIKKTDERVRSIQQLRGSVITLWLKQYNLRQVQYMAGHKYVSSTEKYQVNNLDDLKEDIKRYHPDF